MKKLLVLFAILAMTVSVSHAQGFDASSTNEQKFWIEEIDKTTQWGRWLFDVVKPYTDNLAQALKSAHASASENGRLAQSPDELIAQVKSLQTSSYNAVKQLEPPAELRAYHEKVVEMYKLMAVVDSQEVMNSATRIGQLGIEMIQVFTEILREHGVPQTVIDHFTDDGM